MDGDELKKITALIGLRLHLEYIINMQLTGLQSQLQCLHFLSKNLGMFNVDFGKRKRYLFVLMAYDTN